MIQVLRRLYFLLEPAERRRLIFVLIVMTIVAALELVGISLVFPFISVVAKPEMVAQNKYLNYFFVTLGFSSVSRYLLFLGCMILLATVCSSFFNVYTLYKMVRFSEISSSNMARNLLTSYLSRPYAYFLQKNSSDLAKNILSEVNQVTSGVILPALQAISRMVLLIILFTFVMIVDYKAALSVLFILGGCYLVIYLGIKTRLAKAGKERLEANKNKHQIVAKAFGGIKEIKLLNNANVFITDFQKHFDNYARLQVENQVLGTAPRYILEVIAIGIVISYILLSFGSDGDITSALPRLGLFALVGYKSLPALQVVYNSVTRIKFFLAAVEVLERDLKTGEGKEVQVPAESISFTKEIGLKDISFSYDGSSKHLFSHLNLKIEANTSVAFVGSTGAGKTTLVDIILGLLAPTEGEILIDGVPLTEMNRVSWQQSIGYVPQRVYLSDDSVIRNIAFGVPDQLIDRERVVQSARVAQIHEFIMNELKDGYDTNIGERGIRLSGGQSQRIGIARALYRNPRVLVLDEATSALDNVTENELINGIKELNGSVTIIMIAHRLTTIRNCHQIFIVKDGRITETGTYSELSMKSGEFQKFLGEKSHQ